MPLQSRKTGTYESHFDLSCQSSITALLPHSKKVHLISILSQLKTQVKVNFKQCLAWIDHEHRVSTSTDRHIFGRPWIHYFEDYYELCILTYIYIKLNLYRHSKFSMVWTYSIVNNSTTFLSHKKWVKCTYVPPSILVPEEKAFIFINNGMLLTEKGFVYKSL